MSDWMLGDDVRYKVVIQSLRSRRDGLRAAAGQSRKAYVKDYMKTPITWMADAFDEAADLLDARLSQIAVARSPREGS